MIPSISIISKLLKGVLHSLIFVILFASNLQSSANGDELNNEISVSSNPVLQKAINFDALLGEALPKRFFEEKGILVRTFFTPGAGKRGNPVNLNGSYVISGKLRLITEDSIDQIFFALRLVKNDNSEYIVVQVLEQKLITNPDWAGFSLEGVSVGD